MGELRRRELLGLSGGLLLGVAGCSGPGENGSAPTPMSGSTLTPAQTTGSDSTAPTPSASATSAQLPDVEVWKADGNEVTPAAKRAAVAVVQAIGSWHSGGSGRAAAAGRLRALGADGGLAGQLPELTGAYDAAVVAVIDVQYGGILSDSASVLIPLRQWRVRGSALTSGGTTVDVRLVRRGGTWRVTALHPAKPGAKEATPSPLVRRVLASGRIDLPPASAADVASGQVHDSVLRAMLAVAEQYRIGVSVIRSGHPTYVFGTNRPSDHPRGRAFDTWRIDGHPVVSADTSKSLVSGYMRACAAAGSYNVGGPYLLSGGGTRWFSDATHHDHVHAGFAS